MSAATGRTLGALFAFALLTDAAVTVWAAGESAEELARKTQNPVADLISVPFQNDFNFGTGPEDKTVWVLNVQPVIPLHLTESWNLNTQLQAFYNAVTPDNAADWQLRFQLQFLFPK